MQGLVGRARKVVVGPRGGRGHGVLPPPESGEAGEAGETREAAGWGRGLAGAVQHVMSGGQLEFVSLSARATHPHVGPRCVWRSFEANGIKKTTPALLLAVCKILAWQSLAMPLSE